MGHEVLQLDVPELTPVFDLKEALAQRNFKPDLIFQAESLGKRVFLTGLNSFSCPKIFWSVDTHLNLFWHVYYMRLFDGVATPHVSIFNRLRSSCPPLLRLPRAGYALPWKPHEQRSHCLSFVGRLTEHRPLRTWFSEFLQQNFNADIVQNLSLQEMLKLYLDSRLAPNESIYGEVNFRLMEAASCGCLVFSQNTGEDQDTLFEPGREIQIYENVLELQSLLDFFIKNPAVAERKARLAWERIQREHLGGHRAQAVLDFAETLPSSALKGAQAGVAFWLSLWNLYKAERFTIDPNLIEKSFEILPQNSEVASARLGFLHYTGRTQEALRLAAKNLAAKRHAAEMEYNLSGSSLGVLAEEFTIAKQFWYRHCKSHNEEPKRPESPQQLMLLWAQALKREGVLCNPGLAFDAKRHLPSSALECMYLALDCGPRDLDLLRQIDATFALIKGYNYFRLGTLSELSLHNRGNWRYGLSLGMANLEAFRLSQGLEEVALAWQTACDQGKEQIFFRVLKGLDPKGLVLAAMQQRARGTSSA